MKEIGGYIEMEHYTNSEYYSSLLRLNSARNSLRYLIKVRKITKIYLPLLLCESIYEACKKEKIEVCFYHIDNNLHPVLENIDSNSFIYIINYYGQLSKKYIKKFYSSYRNIIIDNVQAFFTKPIKNIDTIYSCRKYFGVTDGSYLHTNCQESLDIDFDYSSNRCAYLLKRYETNASDNYYLFSKNENEIDDLEIKKMSKITLNILKSINYKEVIKARNENFKYLQDNLGKLNKLKVCNNCGPYMYPLLINNGEIVRKKLQENKIYISKLWPEFEKNENVFDKFEKNLANNILPIPCDQRYNVNDMKLITSKIKAIMLEFK